MHVRYKYVVCTRVCEIFEVERKQYYDMKRIILMTLMAMFMSLGIYAQSSMTDDQVLQFALKEQQAGTTQAQIVTKLMQRGVDITQIRRVKKKLERESGTQGLGVVDNTGKTTGDRSRGKKTTTMAVTAEDELEAESKTSGRVSRLTDAQKRTFNENDPEFQEFLRAYRDVLPDSMTIQDEFDEFVAMKYEKLKNAKKVFGRDIFNNQELTFEPNQNIATPENYVLGPGDDVYIDVYGGSQKTFEGTISPDGEVTIEGFGPIKLGGLSVSQANARVRSKLGSRYQSSNIKLTVGQTKSISVHVMGEVKIPGTYTVSAFATVFHALYMAGGPSELGTLRDIKVFRNNKSIASVDIYDYILNGKIRGDIRLHEGDVIRVGTYDCLVNVAGKVKRPMYYEMKSTESMKTLIEYAGGFAGDAYTRSVRVVRKNGRQYSVHNVTEIDMSSFLMCDGDSVNVDSVMARYENTVEIKGGVFRPGMYQLGGNITSVRSLVNSAEGVTEQAFTDRAIIHRLKADRTLEVVSVDLKGVLSGEKPDVALKSEDVLFVPTKEDMQAERTITIYGEVYYPGVYQYADNESIEDFILQAGGLKETASTVKVDVSRRIMDTSATEASSDIARTFSFSLKDGFVVDGENGFKLQPYDEVYVRKSPVSVEQQNVEVSGEVLFEGFYTLSNKGDRLSDIIKAAGGLTTAGYARGARLERRITPEERIRMEEVMKMQREQLEEIQEEQLLTTKTAATNLNNSEKMNKFKVNDTYYVGIDLEKALANPGCDEDIVLREGDKILVPEYNGTVKINGAVMYPNTVNYVNGKRARYYLNQAGGCANSAKKSGAYIIYQNGTVAKVSDGARPLPGCEIVVPYKAKKSLQSVQQWVTIGTGVASLATIIATLANIIK